MNPPSFAGFTCKRLASAMLLIILIPLLLSSCSMVRPVGIVYTNIKLPLTTNLNNTPVPGNNPPTGRVLEVKEPFSGAGIYVKMDSNAIGDIARKHGMKIVYFADQEIFSILGIWTTNRTILYGE